MIYVICVIGFVYLLAIGLLSYGFMKLPVFSSERSDSKTPFSIIIPFRNESENLPILLRSIKDLDYPETLFEVLFVDDESSDNSAEIIEKTLGKEQHEKRISYTIISNERYSASPKKDAITAAIKISKYEWIVTTDADCKLNKTWLSTFDAYIQKNNPIMLAGPVCYASGSSFAEQFQHFDGLSLQGVTIGSFGLNKPLLCNGANLAYTKEAFMSVDGFKKNDHIASGDDIFLLEKMANWKPDQVRFLKSPAALVTTYPQSSWPDVISQRIRWASKTTKQKSLTSKSLGMLVFLTNLLVYFGAVYCLFQPSLIPYYISFLLLKIVADFMILRVSSKLFKTNINGLTFIACNLWYPYIVIRVVLSSFKGNYKWKGRIFGKHH